MTNNPQRQKTAKTESLEQFHLDAGEQLITAKNTANLGQVAEAFVKAIAQHRFWTRARKLTLAEKS